MKTWIVTAASARVPLSFEAEKAFLLDLRVPLEVGRASCVHEMSESGANE